MTADKLRELQTRLRENCETYAARFAIFDHLYQVDLANPDSPGANGRWLAAWALQEVLNLLEDDGLTPPRVLVELFAALYDLDDGARTAPLLRPGRGRGEPHESIKKRETRIWAAVTLQCLIEMAQLQNYAPERGDAILEAAAQTVEATLDAAGRMIDGKRPPRAKTIIDWRDDLNSKPDNDLVAARYRSLVRKFQIQLRSISTTAREELKGKILAELTAMIERHWPERMPNRS
ncbi:MAG: hypothetical protein WA441_11705 [Methyloceanibacter sp.]